MKASNGSVVSVEMNVLRIFELSLHSSGSSQQQVLDLKLCQWINLNAKNLPANFYLDRDINTS